MELVDSLFACALRSLRYYTGTSTRIPGGDCYLSRTGYTGEDGCEIICEAQNVVAIWEQLAAAAARVGGMAAGLASRDTLRLEAGMPLYGHELSETINPVQAGLGFATNLRDRTFVGETRLHEFKNKEASRCGSDCSSKGAASLAKDAGCSAAKKR